jgi:hypothetical protein
MLHPAAPDLEQLRDDVLEARQLVDAVRRRVAVGEDGHSALSVAEFTLACAIDKLAAAESFRPDAA